MWSRRLIEILTTLICFSTTNEEPYYRHFLLLDQLDAFNFTRRDHEHYYRSVNTGLVRWVEKTVANIRTLEPMIAFDRCWYLERKRALDAEPRPGLFTSSSAQLRVAMSIAQPREKTLLGHSYQEFSQVSTNIHFSPGARWYDRRSSLDQYFTKCWMLVQAILLRVIELCDLKPTGLCAKLIESFASNPVPDEMAQRMTSGRAKVGDFVVVGKSLARVTAVHANATYGYESYTIKYIADPPAPDVVEDHALPFHVRLISDHERSKQRFVELLNRFAPDATKSDEDRAKNFDDEIEESMREQWGEWLRDSVLRGVPPTGKVTAEPDPTSEPGPPSSTPPSRDRS